MLLNPPAGCVRLYHFTPKGNKQSILKSGLKVSKSQGKLQRLWLCSYSKQGWTRQHIADHHKCEPSELVKFSVYVKESDLKIIRTGIYVISVDVPVIALSCE